MNVVHRINTFVKLGEILSNPDVSAYPAFRSEIIRLQNLMLGSVNYNPWFTTENVKNAVSAIAESLNEKKIEKWLSAYYHDGLEPHRPKTVGVVMAGNIPLVGFHDFISVLMSGHKILAKLSSDDKHLLPLMADMLSKIDAGFKDQIIFTEGKLENFDAVIATGSDNTARYFEYYFGKYPHIIRKNRNGIAVLNGKETTEELTNLGKDIFSYFGLGCRNVSKIYVPENYDFDLFFKAIDDYRQVINHARYVNNYDYNKSVFLVNKQPHLDNGFLLLKEDTGISSPVSVVFYEHYDDFGSLYKIIQHDQEKIQCVVSADKRISRSVKPGMTQSPQLWDYADGVDTMEFLINLK